MHCQTAVLCGLQSLQNVPNPIIELETSLIATPFISFLLHNQEPVQDIRDVEDAQGQRGLSLIFTPECWRDNTSKSVSVGKRMPYCLKLECLTGLVGLSEVI